MLEYVTCDVFTDQAFGGNPLAVVFGGERLSTAEMQKIAFEFNYSETTFVLPPKDEANTAQVRIFTPGYEMPFAGHPNVGTGYVLARRGNLFGQTLGDTMIFEEIAGLVGVTVSRDAAGEVSGMSILAPKLPGPPIAVEPGPVLQAIGLVADDLDFTLGSPVLLEAGPRFVMLNVKDKAALARAHTVDTSVPLPAMLRDGSIGLMVFCRDGAGDPAPVSARMFPLDPAMAGLSEDPATGSASVMLAGHLQRTAADAPQRLAITQGVEMGRPSLIATEVMLNADGSQQRISLSGRSVAMMEGRILL
jgi:trans-2,3-dihydro-3-hydroxyanthranilate isomerase